MATNGVSKIGFRLALVFWLGQVLLIFSFWRFLPTKLALFYSRPWGEEQLTTPMGLLIVPFLSLAILIINLLLASLAKEENNLAKKVLIITSTIFNFLGLVTIIQTVRLVI